MDALNARLSQGTLDEALVRVYGAAGLTRARSRCATVISDFTDTFGYLPEALFSAPGRSELGGNHTDHQHGCVLAAAVDLDILAAVSPNGSSVVRICSQGYPRVEVDLKNLSPKEEEKNTSAALVRGVAARMTDLGFSLEGAGVDTCLISDVPGGSGLSSSAAFEVLIGTIFSQLFCGSAFSPVELAQIGQYAENVFFGKPCGLMDQTACSVGGVVAIDFAKPAHPVVEAIPLDLAARGYALCILNSGSDHADLTGEYAAITDELKAISEQFGASVLRDIPEEAFLSRLPQLRKAAGDRAVLRAFHFYAENRRAAEEAQALREGDFPGFLRLVRQSGRSSALYLQNIIPTGQTTHQELMLTIALCEQILGHRGAVRVHGGGFGGTAQAFVPLNLLETFKTMTEAVLGEGHCHVLSVRPAGGVRLA